MDSMAVLGSGGAIGGGPDEWVRELDASPDLEQPGVDGRVDYRHVDAQGVGRSAEQNGVPQRLGGGGEDEQPTLGRKLEEALGIALFDLGGDRLAAGEPEPAGEL